MSILIKGMEIPKNCDDCRFDIDCPYDEHQDGYKMMGGRPCKCPLVPVPAHGRLIDADALCESKDILDDVGWPEAYLPISTIEAAPTIIPAEEGET